MSRLADATARGTGKYAASLVIAIAVVWTVIAAALFPRTSGWHAQDIRLYARAGSSVLAGQVPYRDFAFEYPPLALVPMTIPALFARLTPDVDSYLWPFLIANAIWLSLLGLGVWYFSRAWSERNALEPVAIYAVLSFACCAIIPWRFDLFPAVLTMGAIIATLERRPMLAGTLLGLGVATKIYPLAAAPVLLAWHLTGDDARATRRFVSASVLVPALVMFACWIAAPHDVFSFLRYHAARGLQIESLAAGVLMVAHRTGLGDVAVIENYGAMHLQGALPETVKAIMTVVTPVSLVAVAVVAWYRFRGGKRDARSLIGYVAAALLAFIVTNRACSPQYLAWVIALFPLLGRRQSALGAAAVGLTAFIFPFHYEGLVQMEAPELLSLCLRNGALLALTFWLLAAPPTDEPTNPLTHHQGAIPASGRGLNSM